MKENEEKKENNSSKKILILLLIVTLLVIVIISLSFAAYIEDNGGINNKIHTGSISMNYTENTNGISITDAMPTADEVGKVLNAKGEFFDFTVKSNLVGDTSVVYEVAAVKDTSSTIADQDIRLYLEEQKSGTYVESVSPTSFKPESKETDIGTKAGQMVLKRVVKKSSGTDNYRLRMWLGENASIDSIRSYTVKIVVYGKEV